MTLQSFRTRWLRWLGAKTRADKFAWTDLLSSSWSAWASSTLLKHGVDKRGLNWQKDGNPLSIRKFYREAILVADMNDLYKLDALFAENNYNKRYK